MNKRQSWNLILLFCILIFGTSLATVLAPKREYSETENRTLAQMPSLTLQTLLDGTFEEDYESYLTDQFVLRDTWIGLKTDAVRLTGQQESKDIYFAADDYLIEKHTGTFTAAQAETNVTLLADFLERYQETFEGRMTAMIVPNAVSVLSDRLPSFASPYDENIYLQKLQETLPQGTWFDVASILARHSDEEIYYRTDHHWKTLAAFYAYQEWAEAQSFEVPSGEDYEIRTVTEEFEGTIQSKLGIETRQDSIQLYLPLSDPLYTVWADDSEEKEYSLYDYTKLDTKDKYSVYFGGNHALIHMETHANTGRSILVIRDSYASCFVPFLIEEYDRIDLLDLRYYNQKISELIEDGGYTDLLVLYNAAGFAEDTSLVKLVY
jgi:hypothetical protein